MFPGCQEREDYEDELYGEEDDNNSEPDSELEFRLYSQLHYSADDQTAVQEKPGERPGQEKPQDCPSLPQPDQRFQPSAPPDDLIVITDSGPDILTISDSTEEEEKEEEDSVCARKCQRSTVPSKIKKTSLSQIKPARNAHEDVVIVDSESDQSSHSESLPPYVVDLGSDSDSDSLQSWMVLGKDKQDGDQDIQLNVLPVNDRYQREFIHDDDEQNWIVSNKDKEAQIFNKGAGARRISNRYYMEKNVTCHNCNKNGHLSKSCPTPKKSPCCSLCGAQGHFIKSCPNRYCSNCALPNHTYDDCRERAYWHKRCHRCAMTGHFADACPDIWRQYHLTTTVGPPEHPPPHPHPRPPRPPREIRKPPAYCYNCSKKGHFGHECSERRMFNGTFPTLPFASSYDTQQDIRRLEHRAQVRARELQEAGLLEPSEGAATPQPPRKKAKNFTSLSPFAPNMKTPKRRIAHIPKHPPHTVPKPNTHLRWDEGTPTTARKTSSTPGPHSAFTPQSGGGKKNKKKNKNVQKTALNSEEHDFPRNFQNSPCHRPAHGSQFRGKKSPGILFSSEKSRKKMRRDEKRARKASNGMRRDDENLFLIKQRKRSR
ncbi:zinc finger CCHC domain-containing protein 7 [Trichomycterus rosablanca]|uniref:zinc finger CCHC domain-containing protein 7 n=1 Tax=Trichomycterus rosablanca TaxID=2290929 RepID=UPI002F355B52